MRRSYFQVHRVILACASKWFKTLFDSGFRESHEDRVVLPEDEACLILRMLECFYTGTYAIRTGWETDSWFAPFETVDDKYKRKLSDLGRTKEAQLAVRLYHLGNKYQVWPLEAAAHQKLLKVAYGLGAYHHTESFARIVHDTYDLTATVDHWVTDIIIHVAKRALHKGGALRSNNYQQLLRDQQDFCFEMASTTYTTSPSEKEVCGGAQRAVCLYGTWTRWDAGLRGSYLK